MNPATKAVSRLDQIDRAKMIRKTLGTRAAAGYLKRNKWTLEAALLILVGEKALERHLDRLLTC
jgi:hypothetical protein